MLKCVFLVSFLILNSMTQAMESGKSEVSNYKTQIEKLKMVPSIMALEGIGGKLPKFSDELVSIEDYRSPALTENGIEGFKKSMESLFPLDLSNKKYWHKNILGDFTDNVSENLKKQQNGQMATPYFYRLNLKQGTKIHVIGDLHSDAATVATIMNQYTDQETGILKDPNSYFVFQGDCNDSGLFSPHAWKLLSIFAEKNPSKVFMIQGNHDARREPMMGSETTGHFKAAFNCTNEESKEVLSFQDKLPRAILPYTESADGKAYHYAIISHAWLEHGITNELRRFLGNKNADEKLFAYDKIDRSSAIAMMPDEVQKSIKAEVEKNTSLGDTLLGKGSLRTYLVKKDHNLAGPAFSDQTQWPMLVNDERCVVEKNQFEQSFGLGRRFAEEHLNLLAYPRTYYEHARFAIGNLLAYIGFKSCAVKAYTTGRLIRSHQHTYISTPHWANMEKLIQSGPNRTFLNLTRSSYMQKKGIVETTLCSPGSYYGLPRQDTNLIPFNHCAVLNVEVDSKPANEWPSTITELPVYKKTELPKFLQNEKGDFNFVKYVESPTIRPLELPSNLD
jgi:hypothetical protein